MKNFFEKHDLELNLFYVSDSELKKIQRVKFWFKNFTTCQIFYQLFKHASDIILNIFKTCQILSVFVLQFAKFSCVDQNKARFGIVLLFGVGSFSRGILLGEALCIPTVISATRHINTANLIRVFSSIYLARECYLTRSSRDYEVCNVRR